MRKFLSMLTLVGLVGGFLATPAQAEVAVSVAPASMVADPLFAKASSGPIGVFSFTLNATALETLSSVAVQVNANATTTVTGSDLAGISVYKDEGNGAFSSAQDALVVSQPSITLGSTTVVVMPTTTAASGKFFVTLATAASWSDAAPADSVKVTLLANGITTSAGSASTSALTTAAITADTSAPALVSAIAKNTGGTDAKEAGDSIELNFSEPTNKPAVTAANLASYFSLNNGHSFLNASSAAGSILWDETGKKLTVALSGASTSTSSLATVMPGDVVTVIASNAFVDLAGNQVYGTQSLTGSFAGSVPSNGTSDEDVKGSCANSLINGRLYKIGSDATVYLAAACRLKPFRGNAVFKARGQKFQNIIALASQPANVSISQNPVLPAAGTLVKGSDKTMTSLDIPNANISEIGLYDSDGDLVAIKNFLPKPKDPDIDTTFEINDTF
jgi:hypothetical protein